MLKGPGSMPCPENELLESAVESVSDGGLETEGDN